MRLMLMTVLTGMIACAPTIALPDRLDNKPLMDIYSSPTMGSPAGEATTLAAEQFRWMDHSADSGAHSWQVAHWEYELLIRGFILVMQGLMTWVLSRWRHKMARSRSSPVRRAARWMGKARVLST